MAPSRSASHAGSWYESDGAVLRGQLEAFLRAATVSAPQPARALIVPHAGYSYSGGAAAWGYKCIQPAGIKRCFVLGPSHHWFTRKCALSTAAVYETPLGPLPLDQQVYAELRASGHFVDMPLGVDEDEHSIEMHLPYIRAVFGSADVQLVPVLVGALTPEAEQLYGRVLAGYLDDPENLFVVSSDFCHWGKRFNFTPFAAAGVGIADAIEAMDREGMRLVEQQAPELWTAYLAEQQNTVCGRHPIGVLLNMLRHCAGKYDVRFVRYEQSARVRSMADSSVSYASAVVTGAGGAAG